MAVSLLQFGHTRCSPSAAHAVSCSQSNPPPPGVTSVASPARTRRRASSLGQRPQPQHHQRLPEDVCCSSLANGRQWASSSSSSPFGTQSSWHRAAQSSVQASLSCPAQSLHMSAAPVAVGHPPAGGHHAAHRPSAPLPAHSPMAASLQSYDEEMGWRTDFSKQYVHGRLLGQGSFGSVYLGVDLRTGKEVACKVLPKVRGKLTREKTLERLAREVDVLERLQGCQGVIQLEDVFEDNETVTIVSELCAGGDLQQYAEARGSLDERALAHVALEVLKIVKACHDAGLLHGDVKPANFCLKHPTHNPLASPLDWSDTSNSSWLKAIDFGCSQLLPVYRRLSKRTGTPVYMAPETYQRDYHREADMWSVGVMLYQLAARRFPFWDTMEGCKSSQLDEVAQAVATANIPFNYGPWLTMTPECRSFVSGCLQRNPALRLTVQEALQHPWLTRSAAAPSRQQARGARQPQQALAAAGPTPYQQQQQQAGRQQQQHASGGGGGRVGALASAVTSAAQAA